MLFFSLLFIRPTIQFRDSLTSVRKNPAYYAAKQMKLSCGTETGKTLTLEMKYITT